MAKTVRAEVDGQVFFVTMTDAEYEVLLRRQAMADSVRSEVLPDDAHLHSPVQSEEPAE